MIYIKVGVKEVEEKGGMKVVRGGYRRRERVFWGNQPLLATGKRANALNPRQNNPPLGAPTSSPKPAAIIYFKSFLAIL